MTRGIEALLRELAPQVLGAVVRRFRDFAASEDAVQEAMLAAALQWPAMGIPDEPRAWLFRVAARRIVDHVRAETARRRREAFVVSLVPPEEQLALAPDEDDDAEREDTLLLLFLCCHPALSQASGIALTLRAVGGLTTAEIAHAFLVPETTMAQRITRAKLSIKASQIPFELPDEAARRERLGSVLHVLYLIFNEGYAATSGSSIARTDLSNEALRLTRLLHAAVPEHTETAGLLALMLLTDARRNARATAAGELVPLDQQDRDLWDRAAIAEGVALVTATLPRGDVGPYQVQAAIAAVHDEAADAASTDWPQVVALYDLLVRMTDNPVAELNRAVAVAMVQGPARGLEALSPLMSDPRLENNHRLEAVRAHLLERANERDEAIRCYQRAASLTASGRERDYLLMQAARLHAIRDQAAPNRDR